MKIKEIWFDADYIFGRDEDGKEYKQSLLWHPKLQQANDEERGSYTFGMGGIHWRQEGVAPPNGRYRSHGTGHHKPCGIR